MLVSSVWRPPSGSALSCGPRPASATVVDGSSCPAGAQTLRFLESDHARQLHALVRQRLTSNRYSVLIKEVLPSLEYAPNEIESSVDRTVGQMDCDLFLTSAVRTFAIATNPPSLPDAHLVGSWHA